MSNVRTLALLGATGSIGRQTLDVVRHLPIQVAALTAGTNVERMAEQVALFRPRLVSMATPEAAEALKRLLPQPAPVPVSSQLRNCSGSLPV